MSCCYVRSRYLDVEFGLELVERGADLDEFVIGSGPQTPVEQHIASSYSVSSIIRGCLGYRADCR